MKKLLLLLCLLPIGLLAQNTTVKPDCDIPLPPFTASGQSTSNLTCGHNLQGIVNWVLVYSNTGFSAISLVVQSAPDVAGAPGSWGAFGGTVLSSTQYVGSSGINPNTAITSASTGFAGYFPWIRVSLTSTTGSGSVSGHLYGFLNSTLAKAGGGGDSGGGPTITGNANRIVVSGAGCTNPSTATCNIDIPTNPIFQGVATAGGFVSSEADSGNLQMNGLTSGNVTFAVADIAGTAVAYIMPIGASPATPFLQDSGSTTCPTLPAGAPTVCHQLVWTAATITGGTCAANTFVTVVSTSGGITCAVPFTLTTTGTSGAATFSGGTLNIPQYTGGSGGGAAGATLFSTTNSTAVVATSPTTLIGTVTGSTTVPVNTFTAGQALEIVAQGFYSTPATPASLNVALLIGGSSRIATGSVLQIASVTLGTWRVRCMVTTRTTGASGTQIANCIFEGTGATLTPGESPMQTSATWTIDTTATQVIDLQATWSTATGAPSITSTNVAAWIPGAPVTSVAGLIGAVPGQGTDAKVLTAGTVSGTAAALCTDAVGGATTVGCPGGGGSPGGSAGQWQANNAGSFGGLAGTSIIPLSGWTIRNAAVLNNFSNAKLGIFVSNNTSLNWRFVTRSLPGATYTIAGTVECGLASPAVDTQTCDFGVSDGTKYENYQILSTNSGTAPSNLRIETLTSVTVDGGTPFASTPGLTGHLMSLCVVNDGTHRTWFHYAATGGPPVVGGWVQDLQETVSGSFLTETLLAVGGLSVNTSTNSNYVQVNLSDLFASTGTTCP